MSKKTIDFNASNLNSIGMEVELQLLHNKSLNQSNSILSLMELYGNQNNYKPEFIENTVEIVSNVCYQIDELRDHMLNLASVLQDDCRKLKLKLCGSGTHLFSKRLATLTPLPRYLLMDQKSGIIAHLQITGIATRRDIFVQ